MTVKLRYVELKPTKIFNWLDPKNITSWNAYPELRNKWWEANTLRIREEFGKHFTEEFDKLTNHFTKLEASMVKDGIIHPISVVTGHLRDMYLAKPREIEFLPPEKRDNMESLIYTHTFGGSRLSIAQKHNLIVPCVVHDFSNLFEDCEEVTASNYKKWFGDNYMFTSATPRIRLRKHSHLVDGKYTNMGHDTKTAQNEAARRAKELTNV